MKNLYIIISVIVVIAIGVGVLVFTLNSDNENGNTNVVLNIESTNTTTTTNTDTSNTNTEDELAIPAGTAALFYSKSLSSVQERLLSQTNIIDLGGGGYVTDIQWEKSSSAILRDLPELERLDIITTYTSASYSQQVKYPYTTDGRFFLLTDWGSDWAADNTRWNLVEYDPIEGKRLSSDVSFNSGNFAVVGNNLYLTTPVTKDRVSGWVTSYGALEVVSLDESSDNYADEVYSFSGYEELGTLYGVGDSLLLTNIDYSDEPRLLNIYEFNTVTESLDPLYSNLIVDEFSSANIFPGDNTLYILTKEGSTVYVNSYPVVGQPESLLEIDLSSNEERVYVGEDNGVLLVLISSTSSASDGTKVREAILYDLQTGDISEIEVGPFSAPVSYTRLGVPFLML